jgi:hypothetical protein
MNCGRAFPIVNEAMYCGLPSCFESHIIKAFNVDFAASAFGVKILPLRA